MDTIVYDLPERAEETATAEFDDGAPLDVALTTAGRIAAAEELRAQADYLWEPADVSPSTNEFCTLLRARADQLDPAGAQ